MEPPEGADERAAGVPEMQVLALREYASLLISRRPLERVWPGTHRGSPERHAVVRDQCTGMLYRPEHALERLQFELGALL